MSKISRHAIVVICTGLFTTYSMSHEVLVGPMPWPYYRPFVNYTPLFVHVQMAPHFDCCRNGG